MIFSECECVWPKKQISVLEKMKAEGGEGGPNEGNILNSVPLPASPPAYLASPAIPALPRRSKNGLGPVGGAAIRESLSSLTALACLDIGCAALAPAAPPITTAILTRSARRSPHSSSTLFI